MPRPRLLPCDSLPIKETQKLNKPPLLETNCYQHRVYTSDVIYTYMAEVYVCTYVHTLLLNFDTALKTYDYSNSIPHSQELPRDLVLKLHNMYSLYLFVVIFMEKLFNSTQLQLNIKTWKRPYAPAQPIPLT